MQGPRIFGITSLFWTLLTVQLSGQALATAQDEIGDRQASLRAGLIPDGRIVLDGVLSEADWTSVHVGQWFTQTAPNTGALSTQQTGVQVLYDGGAIYVGMRLYDTAPDSIRSLLARRDVRPEGSDWAHVYIDSFNDRRSAFRFSVNPRGVKLDAMFFGDTQEDPDWDAVWTAAVREDSLGWVAEFRIPLSQLRFNANAEGEHGLRWGINFGRDIARLGEQSFWAPIDAEDAGFVSQFGFVDGLRGLSSPGRLEITPYTVSRLTRAPGQGSDPFYRSNDVGGTAGVDVQYGVTSDMTLSMSLNPDFGQVEADPSVVNLSAFETFLPEKRQFFLEGTDLFRVVYPNWPPLFYSRRIGRQPRGSAPTDALFAETPQSTTILGAAKLTGKTASGTSIGLMNAVTAGESAHFVDQDGTRGTIRVEPPSSYSAARIVQDFRDGESAVGFIGTATNRSIGEQDPGWLHTAAYAGGFDARHRFGSGSYELKGSVLGSYVRGSAEAVARTQRAPGRRLNRPDADHLRYDSLRMSLTGAQTGFNLARVGGGHWRWHVSGMVTTPGFEINDMGFQNGGDQVSGTARLGFQESHPSGPFQRWSLELFQAGGWSLGWERTYAWTQLFGSAQFHNQWSVDLGLDRTYPFWSTEMLRGGPSIRKPGYVSAWFNVSADPRSKMTVGWGGYLQRNDEGAGHMFNLRPNVSYRPSANVAVSLQPTVTARRDEEQYVETAIVGADTTFVVGQLHQTTTSLTARINYTFSPTLSLEFYVQPFISRARYDGFRQVNDPRASNSADRYESLSPDVVVPTADFNFKQLRSNLVIRWEYLPGSTAFVVWGQDRSDFERDGHLNLWRDTRRLLKADGTNVFLVKINYWLSR